MDKTIFNLIDESWLKVLDKTGNEQMVSLRNLFANSHDYISLAGETPLQDNALTRVLTALAVTVMYRYDPDGNERELADPKAALGRFKTIWDSGKFPEAAFNAYLDKWHDRFYLLGGDRPFYQVPASRMTEKEVKIDKKNFTGIEVLVEPYGMSDKLSWITPAAFNGEVLQSANSPSPFADKGEEERNRMTLDEAARWLIYHMNYADCSAKIPGKWNAQMTFTSNGANIHPIGKNLFETIMLCSVMLDAVGNVYPEVTPAWESETYTEICSSPYGGSCPNNLPELYTQQSRKMLLHFNGKFIDGTFIAGGDKYDPVNAYIEPMFAFHQDKTDKKNIVMRPNHLNDCKGWKEYRDIFVNDANVTRWIKTLFEERILDEKVNRIPYVMSDISYGTMNCSVAEMKSTKINLDPRYFLNTELMAQAETEIENIESIAYVLGRFGEKLDIAMGAKENSTGKIESKIRDRIVSNYEYEAGNLIESLLVGKVTDLEGFHKKLARSAERIADKTLQDMSIENFIGHGENNIGDADNYFSAAMYNIKKEKLGIIKEKTENTVSAFEQDFMKLLGSLKSESQEMRKIKAVLRHAAAEKPGENPELWNWIVSHISPELQNQSGKPSYAENAIYITLAMISIGPKHSVDTTFARAVSEAEINRRRFVDVETAPGIQELQIALRGVIKTLSSKNVPFNYCELAKDIYSWQINKTNTARKWERENAQKRSTHE